MAQRAKQQNAAQHSQLATIGPQLLLSDPQPLFVGPQNAVSQSLTAVGFPHPTPSRPCLSRLCCS